MTNTEPFSNYPLPGQVNHRTRKLPHCVIVKAPGLLPMLYKPSEIAEDLGVPERTLRDWLDDGAPHTRDERNHIWINGKEFAQWVESERKPKKECKLANNQAYCFHCKMNVEMLNPVVSFTRGKLVLKTGACPICQNKVNRGGSND